jgi:hypothetical protein
MSTSTRFLCRPMAFFVVARAVGCQRALHKENSRFASPTLGWHISTFCGYQILFSIRNPYINRFTNHFSIIHNHLTLRKWSYTPLQHDFTNTAWVRARICKLQKRVHIYTIILHFYSDQIF